MSEARLVRVAGAVVEAEPMDAALYELVRVGRSGILGEVVRIDGARATVQVYEESTGLSLGDPVVPSGAPLSVELGPGLLGSILDGVGRPLDRLAARAGRFLTAGIEEPTLDSKRIWEFAPRVARGDTVSSGDELGHVMEGVLRHRILVPPGVTGVIARIEAGEATTADSVAELADGTPLRLAQRWPVRVPRGLVERKESDRPLVTGQRILDFLFPAAEGGSVAVPGGFGTGKTVIEQSLAKYAAADVVVFIGCGERGNEMAEVLEEFPQLEDPRTGLELMQRTVMVVNTSNMPVVAREASVYLGISVAEYYRDMGYRVAVLVDSLSRWAEALRDIGARLQEMPGEEGYPTYVASRLARLFERTGRGRPPGIPEREGAMTLICAVSPPGGDFSEPITQACLRVAGCLWALDADLAHQRQFPAVDWANSYSLYADRCAAWFEAELGVEWGRLRSEILELLQREIELREIAGLLGADALQDTDRLLLQVAELTRRELLGQNAYHPEDAFSRAEKTQQMAALLTQLQRAGAAALERGVALESMDLARIRRELSALRESPAGEFEEQVKRATLAIGTLSKLEAG